MVSGHSNKQEEFRYLLYTLEYYWIYENNLGVFKGTLTRVFKESYVTLF